MNVLYLSAGADVAGCGFARKQAIDQAGDGWQARSVRRHAGRYGYPADIEWRRNDNERKREQVARLFHDADVVHVLDSPVILRAFDRRPRVIVEHLGSVYRRDPDAVGQWCQEYGAAEIVASLDLSLRPGLDWLPLPVDVDMLAHLRAQTWRPSDRIRIVHAPTSRTLKSTDVIEATVAKLAKWYAVDLDIVEGVSWRDCLRRKAAADILVDELTYGYGLNALECWAMGMPVVSGIADPATRDRMLAEFGALPFVDATAETLERHLEALIADPDLRIAWGEHGRRHVDRYHAPSVVARRTIQLYEQVAA